MPSRRIKNEHPLPNKDLSLFELQKNLFPGRDFSDLKYGYLGRDENLERLIEADAKLLKEIGLTHEKVAKAIEDLFASESDEEFNGAPIFPLEYIHSPVCPWEDFCTTSPFDFKPKITEIIVVNRRKIDSFVRLLEDKQGLGIEDYPQLVTEDLGMVFSDLHPHLIRDHRFFEGHATPYRVDPIKVARYLL